MKIPFLLVLIFFFCCNLSAQEYRVGGQIVDGYHKTPVPYAVVFVKGKPYAMNADKMGNFLFTIPDSVQVDTLMIAAEGFDLLRMDVSRAENRTGLRIPLNPDVNQRMQMAILQKIEQSPKRSMRIVSKIAQGILDDWMPLGNSETNKFDFGRIQPSVTINPVEGLRLRPGFASNSRLHPHFFVKGYLAYGFKDKKFKYRGEAIYSFTEKAYHENEFPKNNVRFVYENDVYSPGDLHPRAENDLLLSTYRRAINQMTYRNFWDLSYELEVPEGFAATIWLRNSHIKPQGTQLDFSPRVDGAVVPFNSVKTTEVGGLVRYSLREAYRQEKRKRKPLEMHSPTFFVGYLIGSYKGVESSHMYSRLELSAQKRFQLNRFGRLDVVGEFAKIWNPVPVPLLLYPNQRQRHIIENNHFFLTQSMEFPADEQYTLRGVFVGEELLLSYIPIFEKLKFQELLGIKLSYGKLNENTYPKDNLGMYSLSPKSARYNGTPYVEGSVGITNMLGLARMEYVHRFTHRDIPGAVLGRVRFTVTL